MNPVMKALVAMWFFIYVGVSVYGCLHLREGLEPVNLLVQDSYAIPHYRYLEKYFWNFGAPLQVFFMSFTFPSNRLNSSVFSYKC